MGDLFQMARERSQEHENGKRSDKVSWKRQRGYLHGNSRGEMLKGKCILISFASSAARRPTRTGSAYGGD